MTSREGIGSYLEHKSAGACQHMGVAPPERAVKHVAANRAKVEKRVIGTPLEVACPRYPELEMPPPLPRPLRRHWATGGAHGRTARHRRIPRWRAALPEDGLNFPPGSIMERIVRYSGHGATLAPDTES